MFYKINRNRELFRPLVEVTKSVFNIELICFNIFYNVDGIYCNKIIFLSYTGIKTHISLYMLYLQIFYFYWDVKCTRYNLVNNNFTYQHWAKFEIFIVNMFSLKYYNEASLVCSGTDTNSITKPRSYRHELSHNGFYFRIHSVLRFIFYESF